MSTVRIYVSMYPSPCLYVHIYIYICIYMYVYIYIYIFKGLAPVRLPLLECKVAELEGVCMCECSLVELLSWPSESLCVVIC